MEKQIIIFDLGSTIEDEMKAHIERAKLIQKECKKNGINISKTEIINRQKEAAEKGISTPFKYALEVNGINAETKSMLRIKAFWNTEHVKIYSGAKKIIEQLSGIHDLGIIANQSKPANERLRKYGIASFFKYLLYSCDYGINKPDLELFKKAESLFGGDGQFWMIGDRVDNDIIPAKKLGWKTIRLKKGFHSLYKPIKSEEIADYEIDNFDELLKILT